MQAHRRSTINNKDLARDYFTDIKSNCIKFKLHVRGAFKKFCNSTIKKNGNVKNCTLFFNIITTQFNAFATFFWQTVNSTKIEFFCVPLQVSLQPLLDSVLERFIVRIADTTKVRLQIAEQKIVTGSQVRTVCRYVV